ncbi:MAG: hypothetical protein ACI35O_08065 [Bacillaceae bacterium]
MKPKLSSGVLIMKNKDHERVTMKSLSEVNEMEGHPLEKMVQNHEQRIFKLEQSYDALENKLQAVETGQMRVESILHREFQEQKNLINKQREEQNEQNKQLLHHSLGIKSGAHDAKWKLMMQIFGTGGLIVTVLYWITQFLVSVVK